MDLYEVLGVRRSAGDAEIHAAYLRRKTELASLTRTGLSADEQRKQLSDIEYAGKVLTDPVQRAEYDRGLAADETMNRSAPRTGYRVSLAKPQPEKCVNEPEPIPEAFPEDNKPEEVKPQPKGESLVRYLAANAAAFIVLVVLMIIIF